MLFVAGLGLTLPDLRGRIIRMGTVYPPLPTSPPLVPPLAPLLIPTLIPPSPHLLPLYSSRASLVRFSHFLLLFPPPKICLTKDRIGQTGGERSISLNAAQMPFHLHHPICSTSGSSFAENGTLHPLCPPLLSSLLSSLFPSSLLPSSPLPFLSFYGTTTRLLWAC